MTEQFVVNVLRETFFTALLVAGPALLVALVVGLVISVLQAATSIQEFTLTFVPKIVVIAVITVLTLPWMMETMITFTTNLFHAIPGLGQ
jgi:flagellar biosynthetic protein FliQ